MSATLHFGRSARELRLSASSLTRIVQRLEQEVGQLLLMRDRRSVALTPAGERFRGYAREQLAAWQQLQTDLRDADALPRGLLKIACTVTACYSLLPRLLAECRERYPDIQLELTTGDAAQSMRSLEASTVDLAVVPLPVSLPAALQAITLGETSLVFVAPRQPVKFVEALKASTIPWQDIPLVAPLDGLERERLDAWLSTLPVQPRIHTEVAGNEGILSMVSMGCGIALVPTLVWERSPQKEEVVVLDQLSPPPGYAIGLCAQRRTVAQPVLRAFWGLALGNESEGSSGSDKPGPSI